MLGAGRAARRRRERKREKERKEGERIDAAADAGGTNRRASFTKQGVRFSDDFEDNAGRSHPSNPKNPPVRKTSSHLTDESVIASRDKLEENDAALLAEVSRLETDPKHKPVMGFKNLINALRILNAPIDPVFR